MSGTGDTPDAAAHPPALRTFALDVGFGDQPGLVGIDIRIAAGERLAVVGASGAGKTSLLRTIAGLAPARGGRIEIGGRDVTASPPERRDAVYLHQTPVLFPHLTVFENVAFPLRVRGVRGSSARERVERVLAAVQLVGFGHRRPHTLSGGQRHRVALARAIVARPALLLLDEPLASLDPALRGEVRDAIVAIQRESQPAIVMVTHDLDEAGLIADRIAVLLDRTIAQVAPPSSLFSRPASLAVAEFLGIPNRVRGAVDDASIFHSPLGSWAVTTDVRGPAVGVFRADAVRADPDAGGRAWLLEGRVVAVEHGAQRTSIILDVSGVRVHLYSSGREQSVSRGTVQRVAIDPGLVLVFPLSEGAQLVVRSSSSALH